MSAPTSMAELAALAGMGEVGSALLAFFGVLLVLAVLVKGVCFVMEAVRGEGMGICPRGDLGIRGGGVSDPGAKPRARKAGGGKSGLC